MSLLMEKSFSVFKQPACKSTRAEAVKSSSESGSPAQRSGEALKCGLVSSHPEISVSMGCLESVFEEATVDGPMEHRGALWEISAQA